jgi:hypothetical protein
MAPQLSRSQRLMLVIGISFTFFAAEISGTCTSLANGSRHLLMRVQWDFIRIHWRWLLMHFIMYVLEENLSKFVKI